ncbi:MAG: CBS domain-containing protein, partial [Pseudonocardiales bacterium]|nr:CBS domain-containing protein [Pseudonocardiales bacterium]
DQGICDEIIAVRDANSFDMTRRLAREEALLVGGSCGMAVVAALRVAQAGTEDDVIVVLLPDGGRGYLAKVFDDSWMATYGFLSADSSQALVGDVLRGKDGRLPELVHGHPNETVADVVGYLREFGVSQLPIVAAEPPVMAAEVVGSVNERELLDALFTGRAALADRIEQHMCPPLPTIGAGEPVAAAMQALAGADGALVLIAGKPAGVITRQDVLAFLSEPTPPRVVSPA